MAITIYSASTGQILRSVSCPDGEKLLQCAEGERFVDGSYDATLNYIIDGNVIEKPKRPSEHHEFNYETKQWFDWRTTEMQLEFARQERNRLLIDSDWTQMPDSPLDAAQRALWAAYRQALRDVPSQPGFPANIIWPIQPTS